MLARCRFSILFALVAGYGAGIVAASQPLVRIIEPSRSLITANASVRLQGVAITDSAIDNIYGIDERGTRIAAEWAPFEEGRRSMVRWTIEAPLRQGANRITVVVVDRENHAGSAQISARRSGTADASPSEVRTGMWHGRPVTYAVIHGVALLEGDIVLGNAAERSGSAEGQPGKMESHRAPSTVAQPLGFTDSHTALLWPLVGAIRQIPYTIDSGSPNVAPAIGSVNTALAGVLQFVSRTSEANYVTFNLSPSTGGGEGCQSSVGMVGGQQFITGSDGCTVASLIHEMGHTIGLLHEHQRPDRAAFVTFTAANADKPLIAGNLDLPATNSQAVGLYDYASVMHYPAFEFSKVNLPVLESIPAGIPLSNSVGFSAGDLDQIKRLYGKAPAAVTVTTNPLGLQILVDGVAYTAPHTFTTWALNSYHTLNLPPDPQQTNPADGSTYAFGKWNDKGTRSHTIANAGGTGALTSPMAKPAVTLYEANFIRLQPFGTSVSPSGTGAVAVSPAPQSVFAGSFFVDRQKVTLTATANAGQNFFGWSGPPLPQRANPYSFLMQAPLANAQALFTSAPVTVIGESITGPNTWDPPLYAFVDGGFTDLPQGFSPAFSPAWSAGSTHNLNAPSPDIPVTTNVSYSWNSWSDGGAQIHNIMAASAGVATITASYTPVYRSYAYPQQSCGTVQYSPPCLNNDCSFPDGTPVTMTATPNAGNGMVFAGWTGDLTGLTNPANTTIHDEFLPVANFNVVPTVITIAGTSPSLVATSAAQDLTIIGTGFVNGSFFTYWNGSFRGSTVVSPTQATMHLAAGDLTQAGGQDIEVANFTASCGAQAFATVLVRQTAGSPRLGITKTHAGNFTRGQNNATYTVTVMNAPTATGHTVGTVTVADTIPAGLTLVSMAGTGWTCSTNSCSRGDVLGAGKSYPAITVTVNVSPTAPSSVANKVTVSGGDSPAVAATDSTTIN